MGGYSRLRVVTGDSAFKVRSYVTNIQTASAFALHIDHHQHHRDNKYCPEIKPEYDNDLIHIFWF